MNFRKLLAISVIGAISVAPAHADVACTFAITNISLIGSGWVGLSLNAGSVSKTWWICPVSGSTVTNDGYGTLTVSADTCRGIYSQLLTLKVSGKPLMLIFHGPADCSSASLPADGNMTLFPAGFIVQ